MKKIIRVLLLFCGIFLLPLKLYVGVLQLKSFNYDELPAISYVVQAVFPALYYIPLVLFCFWGANKMVPFRPLGVKLLRISLVVTGGLFLFYGVGALIGCVSFTIQNHSIMAEVPRSYMELSHGLNKGIHNFVLSVLCVFLFQKMHFEDQKND